MASYCTSTNFAATFHIYSLSLWQKQGNVIDLSLSQGTFLASMAVPGTLDLLFLFQRTKYFPTTLPTIYFLWTRLLLLFADDCLQMQMAWGRHGYFYLCSLFGVIHMLLHIDTKYLFEVPVSNFSFFNSLKMELLLTSTSILFRKWSNF